MDEADIAQVEIEREAERNKRPPYTLPTGSAGDCELCGEWSGRLVNGACAPCRERHRLP
jgi:hypothetical protein